MVCGIRHDEDIFFLLEVFLGSLRRVCNYVAIAVGFWSVCRELLKAAISTYPSPSFIGLKRRSLAPE
jgi:hypothetical protein